MIKKMGPITTNDDKWGFADNVLPDKFTGENHVSAMHDIFSSWISAIAVDQNRLYYRDQTPESLQTLFDLVQKYHPSRIVELGTLNGISLRTWLAADSNLKVTAIDLSFKPLRESEKLIPLNLKRVKLVETDILKLQNFGNLFDLSERILFYIDAHDLPGIPIMEHLINTAFPQLPDRSIIAIDDIWYSMETLTNREMAESFFDRCVADQIDSLQYCEFFYAPYWEGGSFMGFPEIIPFLNWINKFRVKLEFVPGIKSASLLYDSEKPMDTVHFAANFFGQIQKTPFSFRKTGSAPVSDKQLKAMTLVNNAIKMFTISYPLNHVLRNLVEAHAMYPELAGIRYAIAVCLAQLGKHDNAEVMLRDEIQSQGQDSAKAASLLKAIESFRLRSFSNNFSNTKLTLFAIPKAFKGHNAIIQRNAITSWTKLTPRPNIILLGKDEGTYEIAKEFGLTHIPEIVCNEFGTPLVNSVFELSERHSKTPWLAYLNADCMLLDDFSKAMEVLDSELTNHQINTFFLSSQRIELDLKEPINFEPDNWQNDLRCLVKNNGVPDHKAAIEMFFFSRGLYKDIPPFSIGRTVWDNWLVWAAEVNGATMIDATTTFSIIHQCHDWSHIKGGWQQAWQGEEANRNVALARGHIKAINHVATHTLFPRGLERYSKPDDTRNKPLVTRRVNRGVYELTAGNYGAALDFFSDAFMRGGEIVENIHYYRALCYAKLGKHQESIEAVQKELSIRPNNREAQELFNKIQNTLLTDKRKLKGPFGNIPAPSAHALSLLNSELNHVIPPEIKEDKLYYLIQELARTERVSTVLEIGSSTGEGSTEAFVNGLSENPHGAPRLFCMEVSKSRYAELARRYADKPFVHCYNTSSVPLIGFPTPEEVAEFYHTTKTALNDYPLEQVLRWLTKDIDYVWRSGADEDGIERIKRENAIDCFDMVLIDGSEFTGKFELDKVYGSRIILLDDINGYKNYYNYKRLINDPIYSLIAEDGKLRNGYAIFKRSDEVLPIHFFTIVLNGQPFIRYHIDVFSQLPFKWHWHIIEGVADLKYDTRWSLQLGGCITDELHHNGLSSDGTTEYLNELAMKFPENITIYRKPNGAFWDGKVEMVNAPLANINEECLLWQVDADELWTFQQLKKMHSLFVEHPKKTAAYFFCQFFVGFRKYVSSVDTWGNSPKDWPRVWRFGRGAKWTSHEPQILVNSSGNDVKALNPFSREETAQHGLVFQHFGYVTEAQVRFKEIYYGYKNAVAGWKALQKTQGRVDLQKYMPWATNAIADDWPERKGPVIADYLFAKQVGSKPIKIAEDYVSDGTNISAESEFSATIETLFKEHRPNKIIETGTYLGDGTTKVIASLLCQLGIDNATFYSIEVNPENFRIASANLIRKNLNAYVKLLNGLSIPRNLLPTIQEIKETYVNNIEFDDIFVDHKETERALLYYNETHFEDLQDDLIGKCLREFDYCPDFVLLDSAGHMGNIEFNYLISMLKGECHIALDDIYHIKHHKSFLQLQRDSRFTLLTSSSEKFGFCIAKFSPAQNAYRGKQENVLWIRTDSVGDNILASSMLPHIRRKYDKVKVTVVCQEQVAELYEACPFIDDIFWFNKERAFQDENYRNNIVSSLKALNPDVALNSVYSRESLTDWFVAGCKARERIAFSGNLSNIDEEIRDRHNSLYSKLLSSDGKHKPEIERHRDFLGGLGIEAATLSPIVWTKPEDEDFADVFFRDNGLKNKSSIALFAGVQYPARFYDRYGDALSQAIKSDEVTVIALGSANEIAVSDKNLAAIKKRVTINLSGQTTLRQTAALLKRCRLAVGAETGLAHMACAVGTPNVILLGGGHFGRFMPYSPLTTVVCLPLECYGCNWQCRYGSVHCIRDIRPNVIASAIRETLEQTSEIPRVFVQASSFWKPPLEGPKWKSFERFLDPKDVEVICIGKDGPVSEADAFYRENETGAESPEKLYQTAQGFMKSGRKKEAVGVLEKLVASYPEHAFAHNDLGFLYFNEGDKEKVLQHYKKAAALEPQNHMFQKSLADFYYVVLGQVEDALEYYAKALSSNPVDINTLLMLGHISIALTKFDAATNFYNDVLKIEPWNKDANEKMHALQSILPSDHREQGAVG